MWSWPGHDIVWSGRDVLFRCGLRSQRGERADNQSLSLGQRQSSASIGNKHLSGRSIKGDLILQEIVDIFYWNNVHIINQIICWASCWINFFHVRDRRRRGSSCASYGHWAISQSGAWWKTRSGHKVVHGRRKKSQKSLKFFRKMQILVWVQPPSPSRISGAPQSWERPLKFEKLGDAIH